MRIELQQLSKRYRREWILRNINLELGQGQYYAVTGPNGTGKSTLLKLISGHLSPSRGQIIHSFEDQPMAKDQIYQHLAFAAPYIELIEEFTLSEALNFHQKFKPFLNNLSPEDIIALLGFERVKDLPIDNFSSGMKQRLKLALACCSKADFVLLDEPTTNLDQQGINWYQALIERFIGERLLVIASNVADDYQICQHTIDILQYKKSKST